MNTDQAPSRWGSLLPVRAVRRVLAPAALELRDQVAALRAHIERMHEEIGVLTVENAELRRRIDGEHIERMHEEIGVLTVENAELRRRIDGLAVLPPAASRAELADVEERLAELRDGLHEQRRLQLRVAEVTDVVTELVLPLHDRQIDPAVLGRLRPDTL